MDDREGTDLGGGVRVVPVAGGGLVVHSCELDLGWRARRGRVVGSAVLWQERAFEVVDEEVTASGRQWRLAVWRDEEAMRTVFRLDVASVAAAREAADVLRRANRLRRGLLPLLPVLGLLPAAIQARWRDEWSFPAATATVVSAVAELVVGGFGLVQGLVMAVGGESILPPGLRWLAVVGPLMFAESLVRLRMCTADGEPVGSVLGWPLNLLVRRAEAAGIGPDVRPQVRRFDAEAGVLELWSPIVRPDWSEDGALPYHGLAFRRRGVVASGKGWAYRFRRDREAEGEGLSRPALRLLPARPPTAEARPRARGEGYLRTALVTGAMCLARRVHQERWAARLGVRPVTFTLIGGCAELVGGLVNLARAGAGGAEGLLHLFFLAEGLTRLAAAVVGGRAMGSLLAWPFFGLYERVAPAANATRGQATDEAMEE